MKPKEPSRNVAVLLFMGWVMVLGIGGVFASLNFLFFQEAYNVRYYPVVH